MGSFATMADPSMVAVSERMGSPNKVRIGHLSERLVGLQDELEHEKQARSDAVELKLKVLDDKLLRAQISEEEKLKPLNEQISRLHEELAAERLSHMIAHEQQARKDLEQKVMRQMDEKCLALHVELAKEKKLREEAEERMARDIQDEINRLSERIDQERRSRE